MCPAAAPILLYSWIFFRRSNLELSIRSYGKPYDNNTEYTCSIHGLDSKERSTIFESGYLCKYFQKIQIIVLHRSVFRVIRQLLSRESHLRADLVAVNVVLQLVIVDEFEFGGCVSIQPGTNHRPAG